MTEFPVAALRADLQAAITQAENEAAREWGGDPDAVGMVAKYMLDALAKHIPGLGPEQFTYLKECFAEHLGYPGFGGGAGHVGGHAAPSGTGATKAFKIAPVLFEAVDLHGDSDEDMTDPYAVVGSCDSAAAVLTDAQIAEWMAEFRALVADPDTAEQCDFHTATLVFDIDGQKLVLATESGGPAAADAFQAFCNDRGIPCQFIVDNPLFEDDHVENMYTGAGEDYPEILELVHKLTN